MLAQQSRNITTQTTVLCKTGEGKLQRVVINKAIANGTIAIYDGVDAASGTIKATVTSPATILQNHMVLEYGFDFQVGLVIVTGAANQDITVVYE